MNNDLDHSFFKNISKIGKIFFLILFFSFIFILINKSFVFAEDDVSILKSQIDDRNSQIQKLQAEIDAYNNKVATTKQEAASLKSAIGNLESQKKNLLDQISVTQLKIQNAENDIEHTVKNINLNKDNIEQNKKYIAKALTTIRQNDESGIFLIGLLKENSKSFNDILNDSYLLTNYSDALGGKIKNINVSIKNLNDNKNIYEKQKNDLTDLSGDLLNKKTLVVQNQSEKQKLLTDTKNKESNYLKLIASNKKKVDDLQNEINNFESKIKYILDKSKLPSTGKGLSWPLSKVVITQYFGDTSFSRTGAYNGSGHNGVDFGTAIGTQIFAAADGVVMGTGNTDASCPKASYGKWVLIKHDNGLATLYGHLSVVNVSAGQRVSIGDKIALSGNTGYSTGPHLHFTVVAADAVRIFGPREYKSRTCGTYMVMPYAPLNAYLNPMEYLPKK